MPSAPSILWTLTSLLSLWGLSLLLRALRGDRSRLNCPACRKPVSSTSTPITCTHCNYQSASPNDFHHPTHWRLFAGGLTSIAAAIIAGITAQVIRSWLGHTDASQLGPFQAAALGILAFAITLTTFAYRGDRSLGRRRCPKCWYDMSGSQLLCPECGHDAKSLKNLYRPRRRKRGIVIGLCLALVGYATWLTPRIRAGGPVAAVPTWVLIAGMPWFPDSMIIESATGGRFNDWTLRRRLVDKRLFEWEVALAHWRARRVILNDCSVAQLQRAMCFVEETDADLVLPRDIIVARGIANPDPAARSDAAFTTIGDLFDCPNAFPGEQLRPYKSGLIAALDDPVREVRGLAAWYLTELGPDADEYIPKMLENLAVPHGNTINMGLRDVTDNAVERRAEESDAVLQLVIQASRSPDAVLSRQCARIISSRLFLPRGGRDRLFEMLRDPDSETSATAAYYLCESKVPEALPEVVSFIETHPTFDRIIESLSHYKEHVVPYLPRITALVQSDTFGQVRGVPNLISLLLYEISIDPALIQPALEQIAAEGSEDESELATKLLDQILQRPSPPDRILQRPRPPDPNETP